MNLLDTLTRAADEEQLRLQPLPQHAIAEQDEHLRQHYALLLAALLTSQTQVDEAQTRLLMLLLDSLKLGDIRGALFQQARALEPDTLLEAARLMREADVAENLLVDALVLLRIEAPLGDETTRIIGELATFLGLSEAQLAQRAQDAAEILGIGQHATSPLPELWPQHLRRPLTTQALKAGLQGGLWLLDEDLFVDFPWSAENAVLVFHNQAVLNTCATEGVVALTGCHLLNAELTFGGESQISLTNCDWQGDYGIEQSAAKTTQAQVKTNGGKDTVKVGGLGFLGSAIFAVESNATSGSDSPAKGPRTALVSNGQPLTVSDCRFTTRQARTLKVADAQLILENCTFTECGHPELDGGAVWLNSPSQSIKHCRFVRCVGARGGALWMGVLRYVSKSEFIACQSKALEQKGGGDIAVYSQSAQSATVLTACVFRQTSLNIGDAYSGSHIVFVTASQFQQSNVFFHHRDGSNTIQTGCAFDGGSVIEKKFD